MGITIQQPGATEAAAAAGTAIGKGQRAKEDRASAERKQAQTAQRAAQQKAQQVAMDWELQKMQMRSQQEFEQELADKQWDYERFNRAKAWDIEKMELTSRMDFQQEEQERIRELGRIGNQILAVKKAKEDGQFTGREFEYENMLFNLEQQQFGIKNPSKTLDPQKRLLDQMMRDQVTDLGDGGVTGGPPVPTGEVTVQNMEAIAAVGKTYLRRKSDGSLVEIPIERAKDAVATGRFEFPEVTGTSTAKIEYPSIGFYPAEKTGAGTGPRTLVGKTGEAIDKFFARRHIIAVISPEGKREEIDVRNLSEYKKRGYKQAPTGKPRFNF